MSSLSQNSEYEDLLRDGLVSVAEAQVYLHLSRSTIYSLMDRGDLIFAKIGRRRLIPRRALVDLAARGLVSA